LLLVFNIGNPLPSNKYFLPFEITPSILVFISIVSLKYGMVITSPIIEFIKDKKVRVLLGTRPKYPRPSFGQNSDFTIVKALPANSYYQIKDAHNDNIIIPYSNYTKISTNSVGSYFDLYTTRLHSERFYKFEIKVEFEGFYLVVVF
jgi:hypothetical protein